MLNKSLKHLAALIPSIRRLLDHRDALMKENETLHGEISALTRDLKAARAKFFKAWQRHPEIWVPPGHFYSPIPGITDLKLNEEEVFAQPPAIRGIELNETPQLELLRQFAAFYPEQPFTPEAVPGRRYFFENPNYSYN